MRIGQASDLEAGPVRFSPRFTSGFVVLPVVGIFLVIAASPKGMPTYNEANLSDRDIAQIYDYLFGSQVG